MSRNDENKIAIIGMGAVGVSALHHLVEEWTQETGTGGLEILVFEKGGRFGPGLAYQPDDTSLLLNRTAGTMSVVAEDETHFLRWLRENQNRWQIFFPELVVDEESYVPRALFGIYLQDVMWRALQKAFANGVKIRPIRDEVVALERLGEKWVITLRSGETSCVTTVFLCLGNQPSMHHTSLCGSPGYFHSPYPIKTVSEKIPKTAEVCIVGSRLSAIDAAIGLAERGHVGRIVFVAREGNFPCVKGVLTKRRLKYATLANLERLTAQRTVPLRLGTVLELLLKDIALAEGRWVSLDEILSRQNLSLTEHLRCELVDCKTERPWQSVLVAFNDVIEDFWQQLSAADKTLFLEKYASLWTAWRVGIPEINARKIFELAQSGQLCVRRGLQTIAYDGQDYNVLLQEAGTKSCLKFPFVINATGSGRDVKKCNDPFIQNLLKSGLARADEFGGLSVDFSSSQVLDRNHALQKNLYAIGNLTSGTYFFTSVLELNIAHVKRIVQDGMSPLKTLPKKFVQALVSWRDLTPTSAAYF